MEGPNHMDKGFRQGHEQFSRFVDDPNLVMLVVNQHHNVSVCSLYSDHWLLTSEPVDSLRKKRSFQYRWEYLRTGKHSRQCEMLLIPTCGKRAYLSYKSFTPVIFNSFLSVAFEGKTR
jgi:hypothetical protein